MRAALRDRIVVLKTAIIPSATDRRSHTFVLSKTLDAPIHLPPVTPSASSGIHSIQGIVGILSVQMRVCKDVSNFTIVVK